MVDAVFPLLSSLKCHHVQAMLTFDVLLEIIKYLKVPLDRPAILGLCSLNKHWHNVSILHNNCTICNCVKFFQQMKQTPGLWDAKENSTFIIPYMSNNEYYSGSLFGHNLVGRLSLPTVVVR